MSWLQTFSGCLLVSRLSRNKPCAPLRDDCTTVRANAPTGADQVMQRVKPSISASVSWFLGLVVPSHLDSTLWPFQTLMEFDWFDLIPIFLFANSWIQLYWIQTRRRKFHTSNISCFYYYFLTFDRRKNKLIKITRRTHFEHEIFGGVSNLFNVFQPVLIWKWIPSILCS